MDLCGEVVTHKVFGSGQIIRFANNYITVLFDENKTEREFVYPSAFGAFLAIENDLLLDHIEADKKIIAQQISANKQIGEELRNSAIPMLSKKTKAKPKKAAAKKA